MHIDDLLRRMAETDASDLHLKPMRPPMLRTMGKLVPIEAGEPLPPAVLKETLCKLLTEKQRQHLEDHLYVDFGYSVGGVSRFRAAYFYQRGTLAAVFRRVPFKFPSLEEWQLPDSLKDFGTFTQGLLLVAGSAGSGKSSTLAALLKEILDARLVHVVTIEDPIEFLLSDNRGSVSQREIGSDTHSFAEALHNTLRQDPDVIMVGEMRDTETVATVLTAAETGHFVMSTIHANSASQTVDRVLDCFPEGQQRQVRLQLSHVLQGVIALQLVPRADGSGMIAAVEMLRRNPKVSKLILEGKTGEIEEEIEKSVTFEKMQSMNQSLIALVLNGVVTREAALAASPSPSEFTLELRQFLQDGGRASAGGDDDMADSPADFSKISELQEVRKLYEESQERFRTELLQRDETIERLRTQIAMRDAAQAPDSNGPIQSLREERDKLVQQLTFQRQDFETKIEKLQLRIKELSSHAPEPARGGGLFRR